MTLIFMRDIAFIQ